MGYEAMLADLKYKRKTWRTNDPLGPNSNGPYLKILQLWVVQPLSKKCLYLDMVGLLFLLHDLIMLPILTVQEDTTGVAQAIGITINIFWTLDVVNSFRTGYYIHGEFVLQPKSMAVHYLCTWCAADVFTILPGWIELFI